MNIKKCVVPLLLATTLLSLSGCNKEEEINNLLIDARYAVSEANYEGAREYYNEILELDEENRDALYELKDLEKSLCAEDSLLCNDIFGNIAYAVTDQTVASSLKLDFGDYELGEFLKYSGIEDIFWNYSAVKSVEEIENKLLSLDADGNPLKGAEIRVQIRPDENSRYAICVYVPNSYDIRNDGQLIYGGNKPDESLFGSTPQTTTTATETTADTETLENEHNEKLEEYRPYYENDMAVCKAVYTAINNNLDLIEQPAFYYCPNSMVAIGNENSEFWENVFNELNIQNGQEINERLSGKTVSYTFDICDNPPYLWFELFENNGDTMVMVWVDGSFNPYTGGSVSPIFYGEDTIGRCYLE